MTSALPNLEFGHPGSRPPFPQTQSPAPITPTTSTDSAFPSTAPSSSPSSENGPSTSVSGDRQPTTVDSPDRCILRRNSPLSLLGPHIPSSKSSKSKVECRKEMRLSEVMFSDSDGEKDSLLDSVDDDAIDVIITRKTNIEEGNNINANNEGAKVEPCGTPLDDVEDVEKRLLDESSFSIELKKNSSEEIHQNSLRNENNKRVFHDKWRILFDKFDLEGFGEIPSDDFISALSDPEFASALRPSKRAQLLRRAAAKRVITFHDFIGVVSGKRPHSFECALRHRDPTLAEEEDEGDIRQRAPLFKRMVRAVACHFLPEERDRKLYADHYRCWPPPCFIIALTLTQLGVYLYYWHWCSGVGSGVPLDSPLIYRPDKRQHVWRFLLYALLHAGWVHVTFNIVVQLLIGLPLEMVHGSCRLAVVYCAGVISGSLATSVFDSHVFLVGASGGVYALLAAHLANVLINFAHMQFAILRIVAVLFVASADVGYAIYDRYAHATLSLPVSYVAHIAGAAAGLSLGFVVLKSFEQRLRDQLVWWIALGLFAACILFAAIFNLMHPSPYDGLSQVFSS